MACRLIFWSLAIFGHINVPFSVESGKVPLFTQHTYTFYKEHFYLFSQISNKERINYAYRVLRSFKSFFIFTHIVPFFLKSWSFSQITCIFITLKCWYILLRLWFLLMHTGMTLNFNRGLWPVQRVLLDFPGKLREYSFNKQGQDDYEHILRTSIFRDNGTTSVALRVLLAMMSFMYVRRLMVKEWILLWFQTAVSGRTGIQRQEPGFEISDSLLRWRSHHFSWEFCPHKVCEGLHI